MHGLRNAWDDVLDGWVAGQDLSAKAFHFVQVVPGGVFAAATAGQRGIIGVLLNAPKLGEQCLIAGGTQVEVVAGGAIAQGDTLMSQNDGRAITAAVSASNHVFGFALEAASGAGVRFRMAFGYHGPMANDL